MKINASDNIIERFQPILGDVIYHGETGEGNSEWWFEGGRGSTKSSFISICILLLIIRYGYANAVIARRISNTIRDTVYQQMLWAISIMGLADRFKISISPMEITYLKTGQKIVFRGMDDPLKLKGIKFPVGYCAIQWYEEADQFNGWADISSAQRTFKRGGERFWTFYSYNPPKIPWSWINSKSLEMRRKKGCHVDHSTYLDVMDCGHLDWLGSPFLEDAEYEKKVNPKNYAWEFLGEVIGTGGSVFDNIIERQVTDEEIAGFDNPRNGVDWGWFPDPWRCVRLDFQPAQKRIIIYREMSANKVLPEETGKMVKDMLTYPDRNGEKPVCHQEPVWCDSAESTSIATYRRKCGLNARPASKGNMRRISYQFLAGLREIVIDPLRCPLTLEEFRLCEFPKDRQGNWIDDFGDGNDHSIDAVRYALMEDIIRGR